MLDQISMDRHPFSFVAVIECAAQLGYQYRQLLSVHFFTCLLRNVAPGLVFRSAWRASVNLTVLLGGVKAFGHAGQAAFGGRTKFVE
jgi:hypothetical protein